MYYLKEGFKKVTTVVICYRKTKQKLSYTHVCATFQYVMLYVMFVSSRNYV